MVISFWIPYFHGLSFQVHWAPVIHWYVWQMGGFFPNLTLKNFDTQFYKFHIFHQTYWQNTVLLLFLVCYFLMHDGVFANVCYFLMQDGVFDGAALTPPRGVVQSTPGNHQLLTTDVCLYVQALGTYVRWPSYLGSPRSLSCLLMPWLLTSPGHQQPWHWLCRISRSGLTWGRILTTCVISMWRNDIKCKYMFMFPLQKLAR